MTTDLETIIHDAAQRAATYKAGVRDRDVFPSEAAIAALAEFDEALPADPVDAVKVLELLDRVGSPGTVAQTGGRYFGFVNGGTEPAALGAAMLSAAWDQNAALQVMSPVAARLDGIAATWVIELLGLPASAIAAFCSGASIANLTAILTARDALLRRKGWDVAVSGLWNAPEIRVVATEESHISALRALRFAGIGNRNIVWAPTDHCGRVTGAAMRDIEIDDSTLVLLQAGNVNTGHSDEFADIIPYVHERGGWVHVDGAFGLWAAATPLLAPTVAGVHLADSWATDAHKWLNAPYDAGIVICAHADEFRRSMAMDAAYVSTTDDRALMQLGMQMSQRARGIETWAVIASRGRLGIAAAIEQGNRHATRLAELLVAGGAELLAPVSTNQALVAFGDDDQTNLVIDAIQHDRTAWAGATTWKGRRALRLSVCDNSTTDADIVRAADAMIACLHATRSP
jgi:glutamate/tyrosine decarboxylase-like PLP-dependent enzyme